MFTTVTSMLLVITSLTNLAVAIQGNFVAGLTGNQEIPPTNSSALASAYFVPLPDGKLAYTLNVTNINNVTQAVINMGEQGKNGTVIVTLFKANSPTGQINGTLSQGNITSDILQGNLDNKQVSDLLSLMQKGQLYVNIHTLPNPDGEVRGQIGFAGVDESGTTVGEQNVTIIKEVADG